MSRDLAQRIPLSPAPHLSQRDWSDAEIRDTLDRAGLKGASRITLAVLEANLEAARPVEPRQVSALVERAVALEFRRPSALATAA